MDSNNKPYVFISYAHVDKDVVLPAIAEMQRRNVSLWYDNGIEAGSEWPEFIADKVVHCDKFLLFISKAYLMSQNCKRELNFAISRKKEILSIFLEDVVLSPGMEMQLGTYQAIFRKRFANEQAFCSSLAAEPFLDTCRSEETPSWQEAVAHFEAPRTVAPPPTPTPAPTPYAPAKSTVPQETPPKSRKTAALLTIFLGWCGVHKFYLGKTAWGVGYIIACLVLSFIVSGGLMVIVGLVEGIVMLCQSDEKFAQKQNCRVK